MLDCEEARRWLRQARYTLNAIDADVGGGFYSWACFKAHQAAEFALKAVLRAVGSEAFGHDLVDLWRRALRFCGDLGGLRDCVALLNKMYIPPRYPDAWAGGAVPYESYTERDAREARECAARMIGLVEECLGECLEGAQGEG